MWTKEWLTRFTRSALIKNASQDEQQTQTTRTNINYIQNFVPLKNKFKKIKSKTENWS